VNAPRDAGAVVGTAPDLPWAPERTRGAVRGRVIVRVAPGEAPTTLPHSLDVSRKRVTAPLKLDDGPVDAAVRRFSPGMRAMSAFKPAYRHGGGAARWDGLEESLGLSRTFRIDFDPDADLVSLTHALEDLGVVEQVSPVYLSVTPFAEPTTPAPANRWYAHEMIGHAEALAFEPGDSALICAVVDSGMDLNHPEFATSLRPGIDTVDLACDQVPRSMQMIGDYQGVDRVPMDVVGHGTACGSIMAAKGIRLPRGLAGAARVLPMRALAGATFVGRPAVTAMGALPDIDMALKLAVDLGARVLNLSFGTPESSLRPEDPRPHAAVVEYARQRGCILVAASGNSGERTRYYPACLDGVIAVGSVGATLTPSSFTTRGDHVDLCAPGESVPSAGVGGYALNTGTSFAAPFVAAACALLVSRAARYGQSVDYSSLRDLLMQTAQPFATGGDHEGCGAGVLDVPAALRALERGLSSDDGEAGGAGAASAPPPQELVPTARAP
jgi:subtilisin family serine protease